MARSAVIRIPRGTASSAVLATLVVSGVVIGAAVVVAPRMSEAGGAKEGPVAQTAMDPAHQSAIDGIAGLIGLSRAVVAIHQSASGAMTDLVLLPKTGVEMSMVGAADCVVLTHSRSMQTVTLHGLEPDVNAPIPPGAPELEDPALPHWMRSARCATRRVLARGVSDLEFRLVGSGSREGRVSVELALTWAATSVDPEDRATVHFEAAILGVRVEPEGSPAP